MLVALRPLSFVNKSNRKGYQKIEEKLVDFRMEGGSFWLATALTLLHP